MKALDTFVKFLDLFQQRHHVVGLPFAIIKKFNEDSAGYQAALVTYYGFLSLFPLLLVATSVVGIITNGNQALEAKIIHSVNTYFPVIGDQLSRNIHSSSKSGLALVLGLIITFYGARGGADAFRNALNHLWKIPKTQRPGFPVNIALNTITIVVGGTGLSLAAVISAYAAGLGRTIVFKVLSLALSGLILMSMFYILYRINIPRRRVSSRDLLATAITTSIGITIAQNMGGYLMANQLRTLSPLYGTFALVLGLLFWIYLQATIVMYAVEIRIVRSRKLWPRSLSGRLLTSADRRTTD